MVASGKAVLREGGLPWVLSAPGKVRNDRRVGAPYHLGSAGRPNSREVAQVMPAALPRCACSTKLLSYVVVVGDRLSTRER